jgi:hypothetical protein
MQNFLSIVAAVSALTMQSGIATTAPVAVRTCTVTDPQSFASVLDFGQPTAYPILELSFLNTDDTPATQVTFDVAAGGRHGTITDTGRFTRGATIERIYDDVTGTYGSNRAVCTVTAVTFADGRRWTAPSPAVIGATQR